jgi:DNA processing protein
VSGRQGRFEFDTAAPARTGPVLLDAQRLDWLRLIRSEGIGPTTFKGLLNRFGGAGAALEALPELAQRKTGRRIRICTAADAEREMDACRRMGVRLIARGEPDYPFPLSRIDAGPPLIGVRGYTEVLRQPAVAIIGSRNASLGGLKIAEALAAGLGRAGFSVVSGLARGIDARAHQASLASGTIAVLAGGHDRLYPAEHADLLERLLERGAAISEMPIGWEPRDRDFPRRNRLVSGLSLGVVVVEAAKRSGSLITARFGLEQGRHIFAVPGSPLDPRAEGTNDLIRSGAEIVWTADHVVDALAPLLRNGAQPSFDHVEDASDRMREATPLWDELDLIDEPLIVPAAPIADTEVERTDPLPTLATPMPSPPDTERIVALLSTAPVEVDEIGRSIGLSARALQLALFDLEMDGRIERIGGNRVAVIPR